jgi:glutathionylspermidine synthase
MDFHPIASRPHWREQMLDLNLSISLLDDPPYWIEAHDQPFCAVFTNAEINGQLAVATNEIIELALQLTHDVCNGKNSESLFENLRIPQFYRNAIRSSWQRGDRTWYGRMDFAYNGNSLKLLEFNFDTPTSLYESSLLQRLWIEDLREHGGVPHGAIQSNRIEAMLIETASGLIDPAMQQDQILHLGTFKHAKEEIENVKYLQSCAVKAGLQTKFTFLDDLNFTSDGQLVDQDGASISHLFKLFPWELLILGDQDALESAGHAWFAPLVESNKTTFFEPAWKAILSNKAALPLLWQMAPECKYLLESAFEDDVTGAQTLMKTAYVRKPIFGREGGGVTIVSADGGIESVLHDDTYGREGFVIQAFAELPVFQEHHVVLGAWVIGGKFAGINLRADRNRITSRKALFVPHYVI